MEEMKEKERPLVFDIGFHQGEDTRYYLYRGFRVVAVEADCRLVAAGRERFREEIASRQLVLLHRIVDTGERPEAVFYLSGNSEWNSVHRHIAERRGLPSYPTRLPAVGLRSLMKEYGLPLYCKIDIEGNDLRALEGLTGASVLPRHISVETECLGDGPDCEASMFATLEKLYELGYRRFKLVDQSTLTVLGKERFYDENLYSGTPGAGMAMNAAYARRILHDEHPAATFLTRFPESSGPFGEDLMGEWNDFEAAKELLRRHRRDQRTLGLEVWTFWCDWHATF